MSDTTFFLLALSFDPYKSFQIPPLAYAKQTVNKGKERVERNGRTSGVVIAVV